MRIKQMRSIQRAAAWVLLVGVVFVALGCEDQYTTQERYEQGLVLLLPGIEGVGGNVWNLQRGLNEGGVPYALRVYAWGSPVPGIGMLTNQTDVAANRAAGARLATTIQQYQAQYPGRPVFLAGHSGGGGVVIFSLESLSGKPGAKPIDGAFLLSASVSANYNLTTALSMSNRGILNLYNPNDTLMLGQGTGTWGNVDGGMGASCGRTGLYSTGAKVFNVNIAPLHQGLDDAHSLVVQPRVVKRTSAAWIMAPMWPPRWEIAPPR